MANPRVTPDLAATDQGLVAYSKEITNMDKPLSNDAAKVFPVDTPSLERRRKKDETGAARSKAYRLRKKQHSQSVTATAAKPSSERLALPNAMTNDGATQEPAGLPPIDTP